MAIDAGGLAGKYLTQELGSHPGGREAFASADKGRKSVGFPVDST